MKNKKKVAIVGSVGLPPRYGGFETLVHHLTRNKNEDYIFTVFCQKTPRSERLKIFNGSRLKYLPFKANGFQSIIYDIIAITSCWFKYDTILILGTPGCVILPFLKALKNTNTVINFGGLEWKRDKWNRYVLWYLKLTERIAVKYASKIVADNQYFCEYILETYGKESCLIEYGGDHTKKLDHTAELIKRYPFLNEEYDVSVSRAQPDNNLHLLLEAYSRTSRRKIVLISNYDKFEYGRDLKQKYSDIPNIHLQDAIYIQEELDVIRSNARLYIHSHSFCGTAPSLVEAMNLGLPVIAYDVPTNRYTTEGKTRYFKNGEDLMRIINNLKEEEEKKIGQDMSEIARRRYRWELICDAYAKLF